MVVVVVVVFRYCMIGIGGRDICKRSLTASYRDCRLLLQTLATTPALHLSLSQEGGLAGLRPTLLLGRRRVHFSITNVHSEA